MENADSENPVNATPNGSGPADYDPDRALELAHGAFINYPRLKLLEDDIQECRRISRLGREPRCMSLEGETGSGKSTMLQRYAKAYQRTPLPNGDTIIPVLYVAITSPVTVKWVSQSIIKATGDPAGVKGDQGKLNERIVASLQDVKCQLVILDDFHHLTVIQTEKKLALVSYWLASMIKKSKVPFLVVGVKGKVEPILIGNPELSRFFSVRQTLYPFTFDPSKPESSKEFDKFVKSAEKAVGMKLDPATPRIDMLFRLQYASLGVVGNLMNLLLATQPLAASDESEVMSLAHLSKAFVKHIQPHVQTKHNPFETLASSAPPPINLLVESQKAEQKARGEESGS